MNISYMRKPRLDRSRKFQRNLPCQLKLCTGEANHRIAECEGTHRIQSNSGQRQVWKSSNPPKLNWEREEQQQRWWQQHIKYRKHLQVDGSVCKPGTSPWSVAHVCPAPAHLIYHHIPEETHSDINLTQLGTGRICLHQHNAIFKVSQSLCWRKTFV